MIAYTADGEKVRGFRVGVAGNGHKCLLPCSGFPIYTGEQALAVMESYAKKRAKCKVHAVTFSEHGGHEVLDLEEMRELYGMEALA